MGGRSERTGDRGKHNSKRNQTGFPSITQDAKPVRNHGHRRGEAPKEGETVGGSIIGGTKGL